jgi:hypothetical protein
MDKVSVSLGGTTVHGTPILVATVLAVPSVIAGPLVTHADDAVSGVRVVTAVVVGVSVCHVPTAAAGVAESVSTVTTVEVSHVPSAEDGVAVIGPTVPVGESVVQGIATLERLCVTGPGDAVAATTHGIAIAVRETDTDAMSIGVPNPHVALAIAVTATEPSVGAVLDTTHVDSVNAEAVVAPTVIVGVTAVQEVLVIVGAAVMAPANPCASPTIHAVVAAFGRVEPSAVVEGSRVAHV